MFKELSSQKNQFHNHWDLFNDNKITLHELEEICFAWIIKHEDLYQEKPMPTEPHKYHNTSEEDFKQVMKAWTLGCNSREIDNKSNAWWLKEAKEFFLKTENNYDRGIELFDKYAEPEEIPF